MVFAGSMVWLAFQPNLPTHHPAAFQLAAIAFGVTLIARIRSALRRKSSVRRT
jgi:hypothetical protein